MRVVSRGMLDRIHESIRADREKDLLPEPCAHCHELEQAVRDLRAALVAVQWGPTPVRANSECPWCLKSMQAGHWEECELSTILARTAHLLPQDVEAA